MTTKEAVALLERYSNYDGMGITNLAGCKEAMRVAVDTLKEACPELAESEDERIRKAIIGIIKNSNIIDINVSEEQMLDWLEKQKEHHLELKAGKWYICHRAFCARADHLTVKEGERFQCEKDGIVKGFVIKEPEKYFKECGAPVPMEDEQKEQKPAEWSAKGRRGRIGSTPEHIRKKAENFLSKWSPRMMRMIFVLRMKQVLWKVSSKSGARRMRSK